MLVFSNNLGETLMVGNLELLFFIFSPFLKSSTYRKERSLSKDTLCNNYPLRLEFLVLALGWAQLQKLFEKIQIFVKITFLLKNWSFFQKLLFWLSLSIQNSREGAHPNGNKLQKKVIYRIPKGGFSQKIYNVLLLY